MYYEVKRIGQGVTATFVDFDGTRTPVRHRVYHSPTGFEYGYGGSGPADLARSILWHWFDHEPTAAAYQDFKATFVAPLDRNQAEHRIRCDAILRWTIAHENAGHPLKVGQLFDLT